MSFFSLAVVRKEHLGGCYLSIGTNPSVLNISGIRASQAAVLFLTVLSTYVYVSGLSSFCYANANIFESLPSKVPLAGVELEIIKQKQRVMREKLQ